MLLYMFMSGDKSPESQKRSRFTLIPGGVAKTALDSTFEVPGAQQLPETMPPEAARELVKNIDHYLKTEAVQREKPSLATRRLVAAINFSGAELMLELMNSGNQLPAARDITPLAARLRASDQELFPIDKQSVAAIDSPTQDDLARTLQAHALAIQVSMDDLTQLHKADMEDAALAIWGMVGLTVESQGGLILNRVAQATLSEIQSDYDEASRFRTAE